MRFLLSVCVFVALFSSTASAAPSLSASAGIDHYTNGKGFTGYGLDLYPGYQLPYGFTPELQVGLHYYGTSAAAGGVSQSESLLLVPIYVGARWELSQVLPTGPIEPFLGAHVGLSVLHYTNEATSSFGPSTTSLTDERLGINVGGGVNYAVSPSASVGVAGWYDRVSPPNDFTPALESLSLKLNLRTNFM